MHTEDPRPDWRVMRNPPPCPDPTDPRIVAGCLLLRRVNTDTGEEAMVGIRASEITMWQECDDGTTLLYGHRQYPICAVRETWEQIAQLKQLAEKR